MATDVGFQEIQDFIDENNPVIDHYEQVPAKEAEYHFVVHHANLSVNVVKGERGGPILILSRMGLAEDALDVLHDSRQLQFRGEMAAVLANAPGTHSFTDTEGNSVSMDEFTTVEIRSWVYPDGANQHTIMNAIIDTLSSLTYIQDTQNRIIDEVNDHQ